MKRTFAISDIHGCYDELIALHAKLPLNPLTDRMVFLGDYIDRGKDSQKVIEQLIEWKKAFPHWVVLLGNHEDMLLDALSAGHPTYGDYYQWFSQGGAETKKSYSQNLTDLERATVKMEDLMPEEHLNFLASLPRFYEDEEYFYVHAGFKPNAAPWRTTPYDMVWIRDEFIRSEYDWGKKVIFGHTPGKKLEPIVLPNKIGIDTAVCYSANNKLTCVELPSEKFYFQEKL